MSDHTPDLIPLVDLRAQYESIRPDIDSAIGRVLQHTGFILGQEVQRFEKAFANYTGVKEAAGVASGTAALHLALIAAGVGDGDEVITTPLTFFATGEAISVVGARPIFVDVKPNTFNLNPDLVEQAMTKRTRAIIPVHLYGQPADMAPIMAIARRHGLVVIEDAAQAHGSEYQGRRCGGIGDLGCFSFYPGKNLGAYGDAGMVTGNSPDMMEMIRSLSNHGRLTKYEHSRVGWGYRLDSLQAAILAAKLPHLDDWTERRRALARRYSEHFKGCDGLGLPYESSDVKHVYHVYAVRSRQRDALSEHLREKNIQTVVHYPVPLHLQPAYRGLGYEPGVFPVAERTARETLSLPLYPEMTERQQDRVIEAVLQFVHS